MTEPQQAVGHNPLFDPINSDNPVTEIESYCMNCGENGITRLLLTSIPHFRDIILMAFECPHCNFKNSEIQSASAVAEKGCTFSCRINGHDDLNRQVVKADSASVRFEELDFEIPPDSQRGVLSTVEGILSRAVDGLSQDQPQRLLQDFAVYEAIQAIIEKLQDLREGQTPFTFILDDPAGNSYIENLCAPNPDPALQIKHYARTREQSEQLGLQVEEPDIVDDFAREVMQFEGNCSRCNAPCTTNMHMLDIPHFKEVVIMATVCDACGYKSNEVKAGGAISEKGKRITLKLVDSEDLNRDILKSETCGLYIPEVDLRLDSGTLGGRFTTIEGLLSQVHEELDNRTPFIDGDSSEANRRERFQGFLERLKKVINFEIPFTLVLEDPLNNSYLQNIFAPDDDPNMTIEFFDRTWEQNEVLGLNDMVTENYTSTGQRAIQEEHEEA
ncbi:ZPR1 zinc-finger domain-containing protein [Polychytrium aggregatum]|uniref:ZPR1 zinc-finger domain-containing protein n=1 Tax=Polychytrium aggregatum TaxID=110093 RepID=UPI0022FEA9F7|nr:ZPR1 zinc-finger domain-containing protein [Polychytrium aggregatum]KAI9203252.1 ZPR1 zinc-finger domain-containing protein [Polychytrium aggregatum]